MADRPSRFRWFRANELKINLVLAAGSLLALIIGVITHQGFIAGLALLVLIFFATYSIYAYFRQDLVG
jgi:hypothetical protein